ncbi:MAG: 3-deoxy-8-phosphooctulonate synthase [Gemmatimonadota bacterium]
MSDLFRTRDRFFLIAGPCILEDDALNLRIAEELARVAGDLDLPIVFKGSFDKANRSSATSSRGPGIEQGLKRLSRIGSESGLPLLTDVHETQQCARAAAVVDVLQIPAFLCRQTDLLVAAGATGRAVNIKKGQWMGPLEMSGAVRKAEQAGAAGVGLTERGTFFGYGNLVVDMRNFAALKTVGDGPVIFDGTHSVQRPGEGAGVSGGDPEYIPTLVRAAVAAGADGLFLEVHPDPGSAPSDASNMLPLDDLRPLLEQVLAIRSALAPRAMSGHG